jgi:ribosomal protein S4E
MISPWISSSNKIRQVLQLETAMGAAIQCPEPWVSRHFPLGKDELFVGTCGKLMGNDGQIWEDYGKRWENME